MITRLVFVFLCSVPLWSQVPATDLFLLEVDQVDDQFRLNSVRNLTQRDGYDNQPFFISNSRILYASIHEDGQSDIYRFDLDENKSTRLTYTGEAEYSPTLTPDGRSFSVIRVEADGTQRLYAFPLEGGIPRILLSGVKPVGYHTWLSSSELGLFVLGEPHALFSATLSGASKKLIGPIGRGLSKVPGEKAITFIHMQDDENWFVKKINSDGSQMKTLAKTLPGCQDFVWTPGGSLLMAKDSTLYRLKPGVDKEWQSLVDLSSRGVQGVTRLALSPNGKRLIMVSAQ